MADPLPPGAVLDRETDRNIGLPPGAILDTKNEETSAISGTIAPAFNRGLATILGLPVTAVNAALGAAGVPVSEEPLGGIESIKHGAGKLGISTEPDVNTTGKQFLAAGAEGAGAGAPFGPAGIVTGVIGALVAELVKQAGGGTGAQIAGSMAGGVGAGGAANVIRKTARAASGAPGTPALEAMRAEQVTPRMVGDVTGSRAAQQTTAFLQNAPITGSMVQKAARETTDEIAAAVERRAASYGSGRTPAEAGQAITAGVQSYAGRVSEIAGKMHKRLEKFIPGASPVDPSMTKTAINELSQTMSALPKTSAALTPSLFKNLADDLAENANPSFATLSRLRTEVGKRLSDPMLIDDIGRGDLKKLYGALTADLEATAKNISPRALAEFQKTKAFYKKQMDFIDEGFQKFNQAGVTPENMFQWATAEGRIGANRLTSLRRAMGRDEFGVVSSTILRRMGTGGKDTLFDTNTFLREWEKITPEAKRVLFAGPGWGGYAESVDRIAGIAKQFRETGRLANTSKTAGTAQLLSWLGALGGAAASGGASGAIGGVAGAIVSQASASKLLTSRAFSIWLATPVGPNAVAGHIKLLPAIAYSEPEIAESLNEFVSAIEAQTGREDSSGR